MALAPPLFLSGLRQPYLEFGTERRRALDETDDSRFGLVGPEAIMVYSSNLRPASHFFRFSASAFALLPARSPAGCARGFGAGRDGADSASAATPRAFS